MPADYASTARALALNVSSSPETSPTTSPVWRRPRASSSFSRRPFDCPQTFRDRLRHHYSRLRSHSEDLYNRLSALQLAGLCVLGVAGIVFAVLFLVYNERFFHWLKPVAEKWRGLRGGWCLLWLMTFVVSFPPLIGYSTCVTLAGFIYGLPNGWFIVASATILGSTCSFLASRTVLSAYVHRLLAHDTRFAALSLTLKHDGLKLLCMIRLCPLPYSLSNGAIATFPTVSWTSFALATAIASPKLMIHVFVGSRIAEIADGGMDAKTKAVNYASIVFGLGVGLATGLVIWRQTRRRAEELERREAEGDGEGGLGGNVGGRARRGSGGLSRSYSDDPEEQRGLRGSAADDIALREAGVGEDEYRDYLSDEEEEQDGKVLEGRPKVRDEEQGKMEGRASS